MSDVDRGAPASESSVHGRATPFLCGGALLWPAVMLLVGAVAVWLW